MKTCKEHQNKEIEFVCLDKTCSANSCFSCFSCVRRTHTKCSDDSLIELSDYLNYQIKFKNIQKLSGNLLNRSNSDMRRALTLIRSILLKKKDLLLDFLSLSKGDIVDNFPTVFNLYRDLLLFELRKDQSAVKVSSVYRFMESSEVETLLLRRFEEEVSMFRLV